MGGGLVWVLVLELGLGLRFIYIGVYILSGRLSSCYLFFIFFFLYLC